MRLVLFTHKAATEAETQTVPRVSNTRVSKAVNSSPQRSLQATQDWVLYPSCVGLGALYSSGVGLGSFYPSCVGLGVLYPSCVGLGVIRPALSITQVQLSAYFTS